MEIAVKGHSGCQIDIIREGNELYIYKSSEDPKYLNRLLKQAHKQQLASKLEYQHIRIPNIYEIEQSKNKIAVKMEYIYSKNFIEYFESAGFEQISYFIKALIYFIEKELSNSTLQTVKKEVVKNKFEDVYCRIQNNTFLISDQDCKDIIDKAKIIFNKLPDIKLPIGRCHGDLTFSNILFNGNNYYLIDFLDSFVESPLLDIVKIRQDSTYLWSQLMYIHEFDKIRLQIISHKIDENINTYFSKYDWYNKYYRIFQLMNFLRILQYAHEEKVITYLKNVIKKIINEFQFNNPSCC